MKRSLKYVLFFLLGSPLLAAAFLIGAYFYVSSTLPKVETLADYHPPLITNDAFWCLLIRSPRP